MRGRTAIRRDLSGRPVLVFGSAPDPVLPPDEAIGESRIVCVNGSAVTAARLGLPPPHMVVVSDVVFSARRPTNIEAINALRGIRTEHLVVVSNHLGPAEVAGVAQDAGLSFGHLHILSRFSQKLLVARVARDLRYFLMARTNEKRLSTGMFAAAIAIRSDARSCTMSGISFTRGGHSYSRRDETRRHVAGDRWFVGRMQRLGVGLEILGIEERPAERS